MLEPMLKEPIIVFTNEATAGRELSDDMDWLFCDGSASIAGMTADAFCAGIKDGIVITYHFASMGFHLDRKDVTLVIIGNPSLAELHQAINTSGISNNSAYYNIGSIARLRESLDKSMMPKSSSECSCTSRALFNHGCQCGGA